MYRRCRDTGGADELRRINPDYIQGYLFGKPYPANEFDERFM